MNTDEALSMLMLQAGVFVCSLVLTAVICLLARRLQLLDVPRSRSAHTVPTPMGGGLSLVLLVLAVSSGAALTGALSIMVYMALYGAFLVALVGLLDDWWGLPVWRRVASHCLAAVWSVYWLGDVAPVNLGGWLLQSQWVLKPLAVLALVWLLNLYNFMDGIDGIAGTELVFVSILAGWLTWQANSPEPTLLAGTLAAAGAGFLFWNWPPASIFMGDAGSGFSGFMLGLVALLSMQSGTMSPWTWLVLLGVFVTDATLTLLRRVVTGKRWYQGHTSHGYQHLARRCNSHLRVAVMLLVVNCLWLAPLAWLTVRAQEYAMYLCLLALAPLAVGVCKLGAGKD